MKDWKKNITFPKKQFIDYMSAEDILQHQVVSFLRLQYKNLKFHHSPGEGRRSPFEQFRYNYLGGEGGFPDLIIFSDRKILVIELKIKPNTPSIFQKEWIKFLNACGVKAVVCYSFDEAVFEIKNCFEPIKKLSEI